MGNELVQLREALNSAIDRLTTQHVPSPRMNAELLMMFTLDCDRAYLYAHPERKLSPDELARYDETLARRATGVPAQYITGHQEFWGLDLIVSPAVLVPRPETEHVVETVLELARLRTQWPAVPDQEKLRGRVAPGTAVQPPQHAKTGRAGDPGESPAPRILDVGTGSGAIALALAKELPQAEIHAADISAEALEIARANASRHHLGSRIRFSHADLLEGLAKSEFDFVVSNPPYVGESEEDQVQLEVRKFEPRNAVFAGPTGLEVIGRLIPQAYDALRSEGWLVFEISGTIAEGVRHLLRGWHDVQIANDLQGIARVARARKP